MFLSLYTGQGQFHTDSGPVKKLEDFNNITSFVYKSSENAEEMRDPMVENLTNSPIPTFADSLLKFQFSVSNSEISLFRYFIGGVEGNEVPKFFKQGKPPKPDKAFNLLLNDLREKEIKDLTKKLDKGDNPRAVIYGYKQGLDFWKNDIDYILESPVVEEEEADGTTFNSIGALINFHNS